MGWSQEQLQTQRNPELASTLGLLVCQARPELTSSGSREGPSPGASCPPQGQAWPLDFWTSVCPGCNLCGWPEEPQVTPGLWGQGQLSDSSLDSQSSRNLAGWRGGLVGRVPTEQMQMSSRAHLEKPVMVACACSLSMEMVGIGRWRGHWPASLVELMCST